MAASALAGALKVRRRNVSVGACANQRVEAKQLCNRSERKQVDAWNRQSTESGCDDNLNFTPGTQSGFSRGVFTVFSCWWPFPSCDCGGGAVAVVPRCRGAPRRALAPETC